MKCLILAGGRGERLWPLSRKNYPKQFIKILNNHSAFQSTVARNIPYCDEFIIIANQMKAFQGIPYRCIFEDEPRKTTAAITLACLDLQLSEYLFVTNADQLIDTEYETTKYNFSYKDAILQAKKYASDNNIVLLAVREDNIYSKFGYISEVDKYSNVESFIEKPENGELEKLKGSNTTCRNLGMFIFRNGIFLKELSKCSPQIVKQCKKAYGKRRILGSNTYYQHDIQQLIEPISIEKSLMEKSKILKAVLIGLKCKNISSLEDAARANSLSGGTSVMNKCLNTTIINNASKKAVVANCLDNVIVVNTDDAVYIGKNGESFCLKDIFHENPELEPYSEKGTVYYRSWGYYEQLTEEANYRIRKVSILPGKTIYEHKHKLRSENWTIVQGTAKITLNGVSNIYKEKDNIDIPIGERHQISNIGEKDLEI